MTFNLAERSVAKSQSRMGLIYLIFSRVDHYSLLLVLSHELVLYFCITIIIINSVLYASCSFQDGGLPPFSVFKNSNF